MYRFIVEEQKFLNQRLDQFIKNHLKLNWSQTQMLIRKRQIFVELQDKKIYDAKFQLNKGCAIHIPLQYEQNLQNLNKISEPLPQNFQENSDIESLIIYEDKNWIILNKRSNMVAQGGQDLENNVYTLVHEYFEKLKILKKFDKIEKESSPYFVQRLDRNTTGVLVMGKCKQSAQRFSLLLKQKDLIDKNYIAIIQGIPKQYFKNKLRGIIDLNLIYDQQKNKTVATAFQGNQTLESQTDFNIMGIIKVVPNIQNKILNYEGYIINSENKYQIKQDQNNEYLTILKVLQINQYIFYLYLCRSKFMEVENIRQELIFHQNQIVLFCLITSIFIQNQILSEIIHIFLHKTINQS